MQPPSVLSGFVIPNLPKFDDCFTHIYKMLKKLYSLKDAGKTWHEFLRAGLLDRNWKQSSIDECLFTKNGMLLLLYVDNAIIISINSTHIDDEIHSLKQSFNLTDEGVLKDYLGTRF